MDRRNFSSVLDEAVGQLDSEVRALKNQQTVITANLKELETKRDKLSQDIISLSSQYDAKKKVCQDEIDVMLKDIQDKLSKANIKDGESSTKLSDLNDKIKQYEDLIKSNEGKQKNLDILTIEAKDKLDKLNKIVDSIKEI